MCMKDTAEYFRESFYLFGLTRYASYIVSEIAFVQTVGGSQRELLCEVHYLRGCDSNLKA